MCIQQLNSKVKISRTYILQLCVMSPSNLMTDTIQRDGNKPPQVCCFPMEQQGH